MRKSLSHRSISCLVVLFSALLLPNLVYSGQRAGQHDLNLRVYTYADYSPYQIKLIKGRVAFIFERAGIRVNWLDCSKRLEGDQLPSACSHPPGDADLVIRLLVQSPSVDAVARTARVADSYASGSGGTYGSVSCAAIRELARRDRTSEVEILGHAISHEIGHLLLGVQAHTTTGIMKPIWNDRDLLDMVETNGLLFSGAQAERLKLNLETRRKSAETGQASSQNR